MNTDPGMLLPFVTVADISPKILHVDRNTALVPLGSVGAPGTQGWGFHYLRQIHELQIESSYHPPFPERNWEALVPRQRLHRKRSCALPWE